MNSILSLIVFLIGLNYVLSCGGGNQGNVAAQTTAVNTIITDTDGRLRTNDVNVVPAAAAILNDANTVVPAAATLQTTRNLIITLQTRQTAARAAIAAERGQLRDWIANLSNGLQRRWQNQINELNTSILAAAQGNIDALDNTLTLVTNQMLAAFNAAAAPTQPVAQGFANQVVAATNNLQAGVQNYRTTIDLWPSTLV